MKNLILTLILVLIVFSISAQTNTKNYVKEIIAETPQTGDLSALTEEDVDVVINYYDGLGRPEQTVLRESSPGKGDIVSTVTYDAYGRQDKSYLPYESTGSTGAFRANWETEIRSFYRSTYNEVVDENDHYYSQTQYEASPLNRMKKQLAPGGSWVGDDRGVATSHGTNAASTIYGFEVSASGVISFISGNHYPAASLYLVTTTDENGQITEEYTDKLGQVVCKRSKLDSITYASTYYLYDDFGLLRYVISPEGEKAITAENISGRADLVNDPDFQQKWMFSYQYDERNRMTAKRVPGAAWSYMIYDSRDRLVLTQDGNQRGGDVVRISGNETISENVANRNYLVEGTGTLTLSPGFSAGPDFIATTDDASFGNEWTYTKYDALNRPVMTGTVKTSLGESDLRAQVLADQFTLDYTDLSTDLHGYEVTSIPGQLTLTDEVLTVTYYDNYDFTDLSSWALGNPSPSGTAPSVKGQATGGKKRVLGVNEFLDYVTYFDTRLRPIKSVTENYLGGTDIVTTTYRNVVSSQVTQTQRVHTDGGATSVTITEDFEYDHAGRLVRQYHQVDEGSTTGEQVLLVENTYNEIGELISKNLHEDLQEVDYTYNIRGWLKTINGGTTFDDSHDVFGMELKYDDATGYEQYNGNIGGMLWKTKDSPLGAQTYEYTYDELNRLKSAEHKYGVATTGYYDVYGAVHNGEGIAYDLNGNIQRLSRNNGSQAKVDDLNYRYNGNQLMAVGDGVTSGDKGFIESSDGYNNDEYAYDPNGNMVLDLNKGITSISYNLLNLPEVVTLSDGDQVTYIYDASGVKLRKVAVKGANTETTDYIGGVQYKNGTPDFISHAEGRYLFSTNAYHYDLKDHLGNVRATVDDGTTPRVTQTLYQNSSVQSGSYVDFTATGNLALGSKLLLAFEVDPSMFWGVAIEVFYSNNGGLVAGEVYEASSEANGYFPVSLELTVPGTSDEVVFYIHDQGGGTCYIKNLSVKSTAITPSIVQRDDYYPFGLTFNHWNGGDENFFKYNSFEEQQETRWYDYQARMYDPSLGRFLAIDPLSEFSRRFSTYAYALDNPIRYIDPDGMMATTGDQDEEQQQQDDKEAEEAKEDKEANKSSYFNLTNEEKAAYQYLGDKLGDFEHKLENLKQAAKEWWSEKVQWSEETDQKNETPEYVPDPSQPDGIPYDGDQQARVSDNRIDIFYYNSERPETSDTFILSNDRGAFLMKQLEGGGATPVWNQSGTPTIPSNSDSSKYRIKDYRTKSK